MEKTMSIYEGLEIQKKCFETLGGTGVILRDQLVPALRDWIDTLKFVDMVHHRIMAKLNGN